MSEIDYVTDLMHGVHELPRRRQGYLWKNHDLRFKTVQVSELCESGKTASEHHQRAIGDAQRTSIDIFFLVEVYVEYLVPENQRMAKCGGPSWV